MEFLTTFGNWCSGPGFWQTGGHMHWSGGLPFHFGGGILPLLILGLIVYFSVRLLRKPATNSGPATPEEILKRRYAAGEIDGQTYRSMRDDLRNT